MHVGLGSEDGQGSVIFGRIMVRRHCGRGRRHSGHMRIISIRVGWSSNEVSELFEQMVLVGFLVFILVGQVDGDGHEVHGAEIIAIVEVFVFDTEETPLMTSEDLET